MQVLKYWKCTPIMFLFLFFNLLVPRMDLLRFSPFLHRNSFPVGYSMFPLGKYILLLFIKYFDVLVNGVLKLGKNKSKSLSWVSWIYVFLGFLTIEREETQLSFKNLSLKKKNQSHPPFLVLLLSEHSASLIWLYFWCMSGTEMRWVIIL